jgi:hypothetical protein
MTKTPMTKSILRSTTMSLAMTALLAAGTAATAETLTYKVNLTSAAEVPPNASKGTGQADITYDTATKKLDWTVTYSGLTGPATAAHFHGPAAPDKNAPVVVPILNQGTSPIKGTATLTDAQAAELTGGLMYVNVHTDANKGGEIRGQVKK